MDEMFGISMNTIMFVLLGLLFVALLTVVWVFIRNRIIFMLGLRNIPRRASQTILIIIGLMLSTVIITAAFTTGDTVDYSVTKQAYDLLGHADIILDGEVAGAAGATGSAGTNSNEISGEDYRKFLEEMDKARVPGVDGYAGLLVEFVPVINQSTQLSEPNVALTAVDAGRVTAFPDFVESGSGRSLSLADLQEGEVFVNKSAAEELDAAAGDVLDVYVEAEANPYTVRAIVEDRGITGAIDSISPEGIVMSLSEGQKLFGHEDMAFILISGDGGVRDTFDVIPQAERGVQELIIANGLGLEVSDTKIDLVDEAEQIGNFMTTFFLLLGLFSIGAGILLIVMIFVMLAAERKSEMGMARAVGTKRTHLIEMFLAEGTAYNLGAAVVGVILGVVFAFALAIAAGGIFAAFGVLFTPHVTLRTIVISFSLGVVLTFITVTFSSWRVSNLNIVAAIRDTEESRAVNPEAGTLRGYLRSVLNSIVVVLLAPLGLLMLLLRGQNFAASREERYAEDVASWFKWPDGIIAFPLYQIALVISGRQPIPVWPLYFTPLIYLSFFTLLPAWLGLPLTVLSTIPIWYLLALGIYRLARDHRPRSMPALLVIAGIALPFPIGVAIVALQDTRRPIIWGPGLWTVCALIGAFMFYAGMASNAAFPFAGGFTLMIIGVAVILTYFGVLARAAYTTMGLGLLLFWGLTAGDRLQPIFGELNGDIEMFFLSGIAMVSASTFVIIYNADVFLPLISRLGGMFGPVLPAIRTAVAYPMANRFRTGMTLAMISLVVFSLTMMSTMNLNYDKLFLNDESRGGWDIQVVENPNNPLPSVKEALAVQAADVAQNIKSEGVILVAGFDSATEVTQADPDAPGRGDVKDWSDYPVRGLSDSFIENGDVPLDKIANGYDSPEAVWRALQTEPDVAVVDGFVIQSGFGPSEFSLKGIPSGVDTYDAPTVTVRDSTSGESREMRVIGVIAFGASSNFMGIYLGEKAFIEVFGEPEAAVHFVALNDQGASDEVAKQVEAALVTSGAQADSLKKLADENNALSRGFLYLMQAFMGLGLLVGIAAVGVIAFRTVVERRQQIGMLRAIGYKRNTVALSFILESSFVTILGVTSGILLGLWLAYFLVTGDDFPADGQAFHIPWLQIGVIGVFTVGASLLMTWIPSRQAASIPTAEALRYE